MELDPVRARCFVEVLGRGTVAAAAAALGYTPSAVSQQVGKLERELGVFLFDRVSGRLRPTPAALALAPHVHTALDALESGLRAVRKAADDPRGRPVRLAAFPSALATVVAPALTDLPHPVGLVTEAEDDAGLRELGLGHVDVAVVQEHSHQRYERDPRLRYHRLARDPFELVFPAGWAVPDGLAGTADLPWVASLPGTPCRISTQEAWRQAGIRPRLVAQAAELGSLAALIAGGAGVGLLPRLGIPAHGIGLRTVPAVVTPAGGAVLRTIYAVTRRTNSDGPVAEVVRVLAGSADRAVRSRKSPPLPRTVRQHAGDGAPDRQGPRAGAEVAGGHSAD